MNEDDFRTDLNHTDDSFFILFFFLLKRFFKRFLIRSLSQKVKYDDFKKEKNYNMKVYRPEHGS